MSNKTKSTLDFLRKDNNYYLVNNNYDLKKIRDFIDKDYCLYHIEELTFEEKSPRKEALENVLSALRLEGVSFLYLIVGDKYGVHFYFGVVKDLNKNVELELEVDDIGEDILKPSINGNFRGSKVTKVNPLEKRKLKNKLDEVKYFGVVEGVPGINEDNENFQGVDRLVDVMLGDEFYISIIASPLNQSEIIDIERNLYKAYSNISPLTKEVIQESKSKGISASTNISISESETKGSNMNTSKTEGTSTNDSVSISSNKSDTSGTNKGTSSGSSSGGSSSSTNKNSSEGSSKSKTHGSSESKTNGSGFSKSQTIGSGTNESVSKSNSKSDSKSKNEGTSVSNTTEYLNREAQEWLKYLDEVIIPRLDYGKSKGIFMTTTFIATNNKASLIKLGNTMKSLYSGKEGNKVPLDLYSLRNEKYLNYYKNFQIPTWKIEDDKRGEIISRAILSQYMTNKELRFGNWLSTNELSLIAGLPQKEVVGLSLKEEVEFGLNVKCKIEEYNKINLGKLVQSGNKLKINVDIDKENLNKHTFIAGVTGSGKTTTCQKILMDSQLPFMVIEPAKTEYRVLTKNYDDILIFTLGKDNVAPFRLNPFEFYEHENISSRVDMIKACLEASFDMEAAIPQIIETSIYECYEDYGWNISTNKNYKYDNPFDEGVYSFPTLSDLILKIEEIVVKQGFDDRLKNDYIGSIKARLQGLTVGSKGLMLNTKRSINFKELVNKKVILELEEVKNGNEKSLIMGFVLTNLNEAIKANYMNNTDFKHITLVEEAHRLLSRYEQGDSLNKKQGVEVFTDMLAEVRKYGESLVIVDQIPNKLTPEILKNTNTKIVHKIFAQDDKEAIGNTMALSDDQKEFLSSLEVGRAIVFTQGWDKAIQVQIEQITNTTDRDIISEEIIRKNALGFYREHYKSGVIEGLQNLDNKPSIEVLSEYLELVQEGVLIKEYKKLIDKLESNFNFNNYISRFEKLEKMKIIRDYIYHKIYEGRLNVTEEVAKQLLDGLLYDIKYGNILDEKKYETINISNEEYTEVLRSKPKD